MKRWKSAALAVLLAGLCLAFSGMAYAQEETDGDVMVSGVFIGDMDVSGMTVEEVRTAVESRMEALENTMIRLSFNGDEMDISMRELGFEWKNPGVIDQAAQLGKSGNILERYKATSSIENENAVFDLDYTWQESKLRTILQREAEERKTEPVEATIVRDRKAKEFVITESVTGITVDVTATLKRVKDAIEESWTGEDIVLDAAVEVVEPKLTTEMAESVQDILGEYKTPFNPNESNRSANLRVGCSYLDGVLLMPGDSLSFFDYVYPITASRGYHNATTYQGGRYVDAIGGGICQISTTCYNAVLLAELEVTERNNHSMIVTYVDPSADAAIAESSGKDFKFVNNLDYPVYIEGVTQNKRITFTIYGRETRDPGREIRYESKVLEVNRPPADMLYADASKPLGYLVYDSAHVGYKAQLWKVVLENGTEVSRTQVNSSSYKMVPRSATVGTATEDPAAYEEIMAAIGTGSLDHVKNVIAILTAPPEGNSEEIGDE